jgi:hypothetical protein
MSVEAPVLYTAGYRSSVTHKRLPPEEFYTRLPEDAVVVDIRSHPYSPFMPAYTRGGVEQAVARWKPGRTEFFHIGALGNTHRDEAGNRIQPVILRDPEAGFTQLIAILREYGAAVIFCACSLATQGDSHLRCHRFDVANEAARRLAGLRIEHLA